MRIHEFSRSSRLDRVLRTLGSYTLLTLVSSDSPVTILITYFMTYINIQLYTVDHDKLDHQVLMAKNLENA